MGDTTANTALAKQTYSKIVELEKELRATIRKKKSFFDKSVTVLRTQLRDNYEKIIFQDHDLASSFEIEQNLWKNCFYKFIEDFRKRIRKAVQNNAKEDLRKLSESFRGFLTSANRFYTALLQNMQTKFGLILDGSVSDLSDSVPNWRCYLTYHRSLIFLGDLARYHRDLSSSSPDPSSILKDWLTAGSYYRQALTLLPDNGNPHNQLAVLATYVNDDCNAVYRYFRSLYVKMPFLTSRDNLLVLFEKNRVRISALGNRFEPPPRPNKGRKGDKYKFTRIAESNEEHLKNFLIGFVRLHGILFTRISLETFNTIKSVVLRDLESLLRKGALPASYILRMFTINIFSVNPPLDPSISSTDSSQQQNKTIIQKHAAKFAVEFFGRVLHAFCQSSKRNYRPRGNNAVSRTNEDEGSPSSNSDEEDQSPRTSSPFVNIKVEPSESTSTSTAEQFLNTEEYNIPKKGSENSEVLGAIGIFTDWLSSSKSEDFNIMQPDPTQEKRAWVNMWKSIAKLLNYLYSSVENIQTLLSHERNTPLPEEAELRGFGPLAPTLSRLHFHAIPHTLNLHVLEDNDLVYRIRAAKVYRFGSFVVSQNIKLLYQSEEKKFSVRPFTPKHQLTSDIPAPGQERLPEELSVKSEFLIRPSNDADIETEIQPEEKENNTPVVRVEGSPPISKMTNNQQPKEQPFTVLFTLDDISKDLANDLKQTEETMELDNEGSDNEEIILFQPGRLDDQIADEQLHDLTSTKAAIGSERGGGSFFNDGKIHSYSPSHRQGVDLFSSAIPRDTVNRSLFSAFSIQNQSLQENPEDSRFDASESNDLSEEYTYPFSGPANGKTLHDRSEVSTTPYWASFLNKMNDTGTPSSSFFTTANSNKDDQLNGWSIGYQPDNDDFGSSEMIIEHPFQRYDALSTDEQKAIDDSNARELQSLKFLFTPFGGEQSKLNQLSSPFSSAAFPFSGARSNLMNQYQQQSITTPSTRNPFIS